MSLQEKLVDMRQRDEVADQLLLLEHPPVITLGRGGDAANLLAPAEALRRERVRFFETTRGGDITYHGPGQLVGYPIIHLGEGRRDIRRYVTAVEEVLIRTVAEYGIDATRVDGRRGIWVGDEKIAAIGVRIARWVTSHGFALNVNTNLDHFRLITPCGLHGTGVTSIAKMIGREVPLGDVRRIVAQKFADVFERELVEIAPTIRLIQVLAHDANGRVLLLHRKPERGNVWQPVTGSIENGETPEQCARRELREETGQHADVEPIDLQQSFMIESQYLASRFPLPIVAEQTAFAARLNPSAVIHLDADEHDGYGWFDLADAYDKIKWTDDREALEHLEGWLNPSPGASRHPLPASRGEGPPAADPSPRLRGEGGAPAPDEGPPIA